MLSLVLCTFKRPELLKNCVASALEVLNAISDSELIIINDDKSSSIAIEQHPKIKVLNNPKRGLASARNLGAYTAKGELLLFIDDDIEFDLQNVYSLLNQFKQREPACYNSNWKYSPELTRIVEATSFGRFLIKHGLINYKGWVPDLNWQDKLFEVDKLAGFFMLIPRDFFVRSGGFDEAFINQGTEDDELCMRLKKISKLYIDPNVYVHHNEMDRISLESRLARYSNGAINRRKAFDLGHKEYEIKYSTIKKFLIVCLLPFSHIIVSLVRLIPNRKSFDPLYFKFAHILIAIWIYKGYTKKQSS